MITKKNKSIYEINQFFAFILSVTIFFIAYLSIGNECRQLKVKINHIKKINNDIINTNRVLTQKINHLQSNKQLNIWANKLGMIEASLETLFIEIEL